jgi:hypothetical protein
VAKSKNSISLPKLSLPSQREHNKKRQSNKKKLKPLIKIDVLNSAKRKDNNED